MDDLTVTTELVPGDRQILMGLERLMGWARMSFKPAKSRSLVLKKGRIIFNSSLKNTCEELEAWLKDFDRTGLPGRFKAWIYQQGILPRILWPLLLYEPGKGRQHPPNGNTCKLRLPLKSIKEEFKVLCPRAVLQFRESNDPKIGRKCRAEAVVDLSPVARGRAGLGTIAAPRYDKARGEERPVQNEVRAAVEERSSRAVGMRQQGATRWEQVMERNISWTDLWRSEPHRIKFLVQAV
ncbi:hypothetical protein N1851_033695 [Merluccius polli]|uniref:Reverse transcriptase n=1 Tax=Merluccius polli TaxID=89951 RepID=A0AA47M0X3_MERPO|nr:hypothetical protein N1851_033695 [Merluccius polli]